VHPFCLYNLLALAQREKIVVIENDEMQRVLARYAFWKSITPWLIIPLLLSWVLSQTIANRYKLHTSWHLDWGVGRTFDGKLTLTPTDRRLPQQPTQPPPAPPPQFPD
jgi:hypothetical protein